MNELAFIDHGQAIYEFPQLLPTALCRALIDQFEAEPGIGPGTINRPDGSKAVDPAIKRSTDFRIEQDASREWLALDAQLAACLHRAIAVYVRRYTWLPKLPTSFCGFQIQRTRAGEGFDWHADEDRRRRLALIFYLNDDFEGGGTQFEQQALTIRPRTGSLLMFPPFWTHTHRGCVVESGNKYIVTSFLLHA